MSLTREQKRELSQLSEQLKKIEELAVSNNIDLDVFMSEYNDKGFAFYKTEKISLNKKSNLRKNIFEKSGNEKPQSAPKSH